MIVALIYSVTFNIVTVQELWRAFFLKSCDELVKRFLEEIVPDDEAAKLLHPELVRSMQRDRFRFYFLDPNSEDPVFVEPMKAEAGQGEGEEGVAAFVRMCISYHFPKDEKLPEDIVGDVEYLGEHYLADLKFRKTAERLLV